MLKATYQSSQTNMSQISDYTDDSNLLSSDFKQNFDLVSPEEIQYYSETLLHDYEELNRKSYIFGLPIPQRVVDLRKWMEENLHPQLQMSEQEPTFYHDILVIKKVIRNFFLRFQKLSIERYIRTKFLTSHQCSSMLNESIATLFFFRSW